MDPREIVEFMLEQKGLSRSDLAEGFGGRSRVSEFFKGSRTLSIRQIAALTKNLGIPADLLIARDRRS
jgi:HTH-type transcriptional regulator/antitoxin HigA